MGEVKLYQSQLDAIRKMKNGCILCGRVGSGKSLTALGYFYLLYGGDKEFLSGGKFKPMTDPEIPDLYIITTAMKRDTLEWESELNKFYLSYRGNTPPDIYEGMDVVVDSWNNIEKYSKKWGFFIFDEQRVVGSGKWAKTFLKITQNPFNRWIMLSATPGDKWEDYMTVFVANGFYKNYSDFRRQHLVYNNYSKFPKVDRYLGEAKLQYLRDSILVDINIDGVTRKHHINVETEYDKEMYKQVGKTRWDPYKNIPIESPPMLCYIWRKISNTDISRSQKVLEILSEHPKSIIFYNFDYELDILKNLEFGANTVVKEWNGHKHDPLPEGNSWVYLVQYTAGSEGWNCITTNTIIFYSQTYSYRATEQASGRIDRMNTPFEDLYFYHLKSKSPIDLAISRALKNKESFNERKWLNGRN